MYGAYQGSLAVVMEVQTSVTKSSGNSNSPNWSSMAVEKLLLSPIPLPKSTIVWAKNRNDNDVADN